MRRYALLLGLGTMGAILACGGGTGPFDAVETRLEVDRSRASVGDVILLRAIATNHGTRALATGAGCGEGLDFEVRLPTGERQLLLRGPSLCPRYDSNDLEPGETDTVSHGWRVPGPPGTYRLWAGARVSAGIAARSGAVEVVID